MGFKIKKGEENHVHLEIIKAEFNPKTGKQKFKPFMQTFTPKEYKSFLEYPNGMGVIKIHHLPEGVKDIESLRKEYSDKKKGARRVNAIDLSGSVASVYSGEEESESGEGGNGGEGSEGGEGGNGPGPQETEVKNMKNMKRAELDEYAKEFDIDPSEYTNATALKEAIQIEIDEKGLE